MNGSLYPSETVPFQVDKRIATELADQDRKTLMSLLASSVFLMLAPVLLKAFLPLPMRTLMHLGSVGTAAGAAVVSHNASTGKRHRFAVAVDRMQNDFIQDLYTYRQAGNKIKLEIASRKDLAYYLQAFPPRERAYWAARYGVDHLVEYPEVATGPVALPPSNGLPQTPIIPLHQSAISVADAESEIDFSWMDWEFWFNSKIVLGIKGSGKSMYLKNEAFEFKKLCPNSILKIGDIHFDSREVEKQWLSGLDVNVLEKEYVSKRPEDILKTLIEIHSLLRKRINESDHVGERAVDDIKRQGFTNEPVARYIIDEFVNWLSRFKKSEQEEIVQKIQEIEFEGRKYGIFLTLGLHSFKTKQAAIDSSVFLGMVFLALGNSLADPNTKFSNDINVPALLEAQEQLKAMYPKRHTAILRIPDSQAIAVVMPVFSWPKVRTAENTSNPHTPAATGESNHEAEDTSFLDITSGSFSESEGPGAAWDEVLQDLIFFCKTIWQAERKLPTDSELKDRFESSAKRELVGRGLEYVKSELKEALKGEGIDTTGW